MCKTDPKIDKSFQNFSISEADRARVEDDFRQWKVEKGLDYLDAVFDGGKFREVLTLPEVAKENLGNQKVNYYLDKSTVTRGDQESFEGMKPLLREREKAMKQYFNPQLRRQFKDATADVTYALSRAGLLDSSAAGEKQADLTRQYGLAEGDILAKVAADQSDTRSNMNVTRNGIESGLRASGDASSAANQALQAAVSFREDMPDLSPLGHLFAGLSEGIGSGIRGYRGGQISNMANPMRSGVIPVSSGSGSVIN